MSSLTHEDPDGTGKVRSAAAMPKVFPPNTNEGSSSPGEIGLQGPDFQIAGAVGTDALRGSDCAC